MSNKNKSGQGGTDLLDKEDIKIQKPKKYKVVFHNDDYTPMDFVMIILMQVFRKSPEEAVNITMSVHNKGKGIAGVYSKEISETKSAKVNLTAQQSGYPLLTTIEPE
jgi:ATP-dependent Clp protease adaptor protein ClpS